MTDSSINRTSQHPTEAELNREYFQFKINLWSSVLHQSMGATNIPDPIVWANTVLNAFELRFDKKVG